jgi:SagB-type dehydrogenase family enzyme
VGRASLKLKSASCQMAYWSAGELRIANYLTRREFSANPATLEVVRFFFTPRTIEDALSEFRSYSRKSVARAILQLIHAQLLLEFESAEQERDEWVGSSWGPWLPEGGFHFMTKDTPYVPGDWPAAEKQKMLAATPAPPQFKKVRGGHTVRLPSHEMAADAFFETLRARRTHRKFAKGKVSLENVSKLLQTTWGVQGYFQTNVFGKLPYKTSPSGGARHPGEVYLMALKVDGLETGLYHYDPRDHRLARLPARASPRLASAYCADQRYFAGAAALFIMTAVFARTMWKYGRARAYRVVLLETGHLCQTFCLTATRLGLAPFSTAALKDTLIEKHLGLDGISESVLYVAGVGLAAGRSHRTSRSSWRNSSASSSGRASATRCPPGSTRVSNPRRSRATRC